MRTVRTLWLSAFAGAALTAGCATIDADDGYAYARRPVAAPAPQVVDYPTGLTYVATQPPPYYTDGRLIFSAGSERYVWALRHAPDEDAREEAAEQLGESGNLWTLPYLREAARSDPSEDVREEAREAIEEMRERFDYEYDEERFEYWD